MKNRIQVHPDLGRNQPNSQAHNPHTDPVKPGEPRTDERLSRFSALLRNLEDHVNKQSFFNESVSDRLRLWSCEDAVSDSQLDSFAAGFQFVSGEVNDSLRSLQSDLFRMWCDLSKHLRHLLPTELVSPSVGELLEDLLSHEPNQLMDWKVEQWAWLSQKLLSPEDRDRCARIARAYSEIAALQLELQARKGAV